MKIIVPITSEKQTVFSNDEIDQISNVFNEIKNLKLDGSSQISDDFQCTNGKKKKYHMLSPETKQKFVDLVMK